VTDPTSATDCSVCAELGREILSVMREHLRAESELANAMFVLQDFSVAREADARARRLIKERQVLKIRLENHKSAAHESLAATPPFVRA
jgi:hypothetical protein